MRTGQAQRGAGRRAGWTRGPGIGPVGTVLKAAPPLSCCPWDPTAKSLPSRTARLGAEHSGWAPGAPCPSRPGCPPWRSWAGTNNFPPQARPGPGVPSCRSLRRAHEPAPLTVQPPSPTRRTTLEERVGRGRKGQCHLGPPWAGAGALCRPLEASHGPGSEKPPEPKSSGRHGSPRLATTTCDHGNTSQQGPRCFHRPFILSQTRSSRRQGQACPRDYNCTGGR